MATASGLPQPSVIEELLADPQRFNFFQLIRLLEMLAPDSVPVGEGGDPSAEAVRFRSSFSLAFPPSDVVAIEKPSGDKQVPTVTRAGIMLEVPTAAATATESAALRGTLRCVTSWTSSIIAWCPCCIASGVAVGWEQSGLPPMNTTLRAFCLASQEC